MERGFYSGGEQKASKTPKLITSQEARPPVEGSSCYAGGAKNWIHPSSPPPPSRRCPSIATAPLNRLHIHTYNQSFEFSAQKHRKLIESTRRKIKEN